MKPADTCVAFRPGRLLMPCATCRTWPEAPHVIGALAYCPAHCPACKSAAVAQPVSHRGGQPLNKRKAAA
jgi:hypothetical protein